MEPRFGADFSGVRIHTGSEAAQLNREVSAQAFTHGQDIYLGEGKTDVASAQGKQLLAHELTHTIQQGASPQAQRDAGPGQPPVAGVTSGLQREVIQRSAFEERLTWDNWKTASYKWGWRRTDWQKLMRP